MVSTRSRTAKSKRDNLSVSKNQKWTRPEEEISEEDEEISKRNRVPESSCKEVITFARDDHDKDDDSHHQQGKFLNSVLLFLH